MDAGDAFAVAVSDLRSSAGRFCTNAVTPSMKSREAASSSWIDASSSSWASMRANCQALSWRLVPA